MRRFLVDALLVVLLVSLATYIQEPNTKEDIDEKIASFEQDVAQHKPADPKVEVTYLNEIEENKAAKFAKASSDIVIDVMDTSLTLVEEFFNGFFR